MELLELADLIKNASVCNPVVLKYTESESQGYGYDGTSYETIYLNVIGGCEENDNILLKCSVSVKFYEFHEYMGKVKKNAPTIEYYTDFCATRRYKDLSFVKGNRFPADVIKTVTTHLERKKKEACHNYDLWVNTSEELQKL